MERKNFFLIVLILFIASAVIHGQRIFRPMNPGNPWQGMVNRLIPVHHSFISDQLHITIKYLTLSIILI